MRRILALGLIGAPLLGGAPAVYAHAFLDRAEPRVGSTQTKRPREIILVFTEKIKPTLSTVAVYDRAGSRLDLGKVNLDVHNATILHVPIQPIGPGTYRVVWRVVSVDTDQTEGRFTFSIALPVKRPGSVE